MFKLQQYKLIISTQLERCHITASVSQSVLGSCTSSIWKCHVWKLKPCCSSNVLILCFLTNGLVCLCRKREARRLFLTMKVSLQFYYIPVCRTPAPVSPVKVRQLPLVNTPSACYCMKVNTPIVNRTGQHLIFFYYSAVVAVCSFKWFCIDSAEKYSVYSTPL